MSCPKLKKGFTVVELLVAIMIITILAGALLSMKSSFTHRQQLVLSGLKLASDLRLTQQFARTIKDDYRYYGLKFYSNLGEDGDRDGYKIVRYNPQGVDVTPPVNFTDFGIIKTSQESDMATDPVEFIEDTFFTERVVMDASSEFQIGGAGWPSEKPNVIVFTPEGSATFDGETLLDATSDEVILTDGTYKVTVQIIPLTGYIRVLEQ